METGAPFCLTWRDSALYALAVGAARGPRYAWAQDERFVNERHPRFTTLPTLACTFALRGGTQSLTEALAGAGLRFDPSTLLHTEQVVRLHAPGLLPSAENREVVSLLNSTRLVSVAERASGTLARVQTECRRSSDGALVATSTVGVLLRNKEPRISARAPKAAQPPPRSLADSSAAVVWEERIDANAALLYRLCGDENPLHVDASVAAQAGFPAPILHGLCTLGYAVRAVILRLLGGEAGEVELVRCIFVGVVFPGTVLVTRMLRLSPTLIQFDCSSEGRLVLAGGQVQLRAAAKL